MLGSRVYGLRSSHHLEGFLHGANDVGQVVLHVPLQVNGNCKRDDLEVIRNHFDGSRLLLGVESHSRQGVENVLEVLDNGVGVRALGQDLEQHTVRDKVEAREGVTLCLEVACRGFGVWGLGFRRCALSRGSLSRVWGLGFRV
jgi:hypothetical protein